MLRSEMRETMKAGVRRHAMWTSILSQDPSVMELALVWFVIVALPATLIYGWIARKREH
jgi:Zn-dependent protease with chaperone function